MDHPEPPRLHAAATTRNREPIGAVLERVLPRRGTVLEVGSGTGQHAAWFAPRMPHLTWVPSDPDPARRASIAAWARECGAPNLRDPLDLDVHREPWPLAAADAVVCINVLHIAPASASAALARGAARVLPVGGVLYLYGPYKVGGVHTAESNAAFDRGLRAQDPAWGVRDLEEVVAAAVDAGFALRETVAMPANNLSVVLTRGP